MTLKIGNSQSSNDSSVSFIELVEKENLLTNSAAENEAAINHLANNNPTTKINPSNSASDDKKTVGDFLRKVNAEQPFDDGNLSKKEVRVFVDVKKPVNQTTVSDYDKATWRAIFQKAGYGMLTDEEIALAVGGMNAVGWTVKDSGFDLSSLRVEDAKPGAMVVKTNQAIIERAKRAGQAVLQYQEYKSNEADLQKQLAESRTNQMLLDPLRLGGNTPVRWAERMLNTPRDLLQQIDKGEIMPGTSTAKWAGKKIAEQITGQELPDQPSFSEQIQKTTGIKLPAIPEIELSRPFEYKSEKYQADGKTGEEVGATAIDLFLLNRGLFGKSNSIPQSLELNFPLRNGNSAKIGIVNAQNELDPLLAKRVGMEISNNPLATRAYSQIQKQGTEMKLDFGNPPSNRTFGQYDYNRNKVEIFMQNNGTAKEAVSTMVHESRHVKNKFLGKANTQYDEFRAFTREFLYTEGRRPNLKERIDIWDMVKKNYPDLQMEKNPTINIIKENK